MSKTIYAECSICGNRGGYDKESLDGSTWNINGVDIILCCNCEDELLQKLCKARGTDYYFDFDIVEE